MAKRMTTGLKDALIFALDEAVSSKEEKIKWAEQNINPRDREALEIIPDSKADITAFKEAKKMLKQLPVC